MSITCCLYCNITSYDYMYRESCNLPLSSITGAFGPTNMAIAPAPPVHQTSCGIYCNITSYDYMYRESCNLPLSSITEAFGPTNMAIAPAQPVQRAFPVVYTAISPAMTTTIANLVTYLGLVLRGHLVQPTWQYHQHHLYNEHFLWHILQYHQL